MQQNNKIAKNNHPRMRRRLTIPALDIIICRYTVFRAINSCEQLKHCEKRMNQNGKQVQLVFTVF